jgi:hypothetical protein
MLWVPFVISVFAAGYFSHDFFSRTGADQVLSLATRGIYLYISVFLSAYLALVLKYESSRTIRLIAWGVLGLAFSGVLGVLLNDERAMRPIDVLRPVVEHDPAIEEQCQNTRFLEAARCVARVQRRPWDPLLTVSSSRPFEAVVEFKFFTPEMADYVERASRGDIRLLVDLFVFQAVIPFEVTISGSGEALTLEEKTKHAMTPSQAAAFYAEKRVVFKTVLGEGQMVPIPPRSFLIRNPDYALPYRKDSARFDGKRFPFPKGETFLATFQFETLGHVPLALFY